MWPWLLAGAAALIVLAALGTGGSGEETGSSASTTARETVAASPESEAGITETVPVGQSARDGKFEFVVQGIDRSNRVGGEFLGTDAKGEFVNVHLRVTNIGDEARSFYSGNQYLIVDGNRYDAEFVMDRMDADAEDINPGLSMDATVSFDVPVGSQPTAVELHDSAFSGGATMSLR